jgi:predicted ester cyclase
LTAAGHPGAASGLLIWRDRIDQHRRYVRSRGQARPLTIKQSLWVTDNKRVVRTHLLEAVSQQRPELWEELMDPGFVLHHPLVEPGRAAYESVLRVLWTAFPDLRVELLDLVAEGDRVVVRYIERGTHLGDFMGMAPSGRTYEKHGFTLYRLDNGRLIEAWLQEDNLGYQQQLFG